MKLIKATINDFRSINCTTEFEIGQRTCLVGKNEAGKTAVLQALHGLKPIPPFSYNRERDYPRARLNNYKSDHGGGNANVCETSWKLDPEEISKIESIHGSNCMKSDVIEVRNYYDDDEQYWTVPLDESKALAHLLSSTNFDAVEQSQIGTPNTTSELRAKLKAVSEPTAKLEALLERIESWPDGSPTQAIIDSLDMPHFMYFSHYDRMSGQLSVEQYAKDESSRNAKEGDRVFVDFLEYAGTTIEELKTSTTFESLNTKCEGASNAITDQIFEYWTQNDSLLSLIHI